MKRLTIEKKSTCFEYTVKKKNQYLGDITMHEIGRKTKWCFFPDDFPMIGDMWFTDDCLREIADFLSSLNLKKESQK